ncbi:MAG TPA: 2Fe-2S iron-sulfur cluster binding domain-containing protein [Deltaproteobacteria bacterium]|nr:molybdopterin-dependent oxidoreductase [SAR324 cluster bacterium]HIL15634.1 2Fe-2S iron-sulfur cluster binding domain-containing protein [Deltaproteobacteria bacterium]|tara:strand:+ start:7875 stop:9515 length:1641 start_codon:yes stop_codon:yes gene_type:complete
MPVFHLDGQPVEFEPGEKVLSAALRAGVEVPHYCFHPGLSVVATCRMCLVDVVDMGNGRPMPKLQTSCSMDAVEGMKVETQNTKTLEAREDVMEFLLINHPLDCPICDQSGECVLQDYSFEHGTGKSEMEYAKRVYGWRDIGTFVALERNRCIHCTRCDRFTREVTGTNEFGMYNRGHELTVDTYADRPMTNKFQGNMADICPVGAITDKEFRFKRRVWRLKKTPSICTGCSTGCNVTIEYDKNEVFRLKPRENPAVNRWWMCDEGRLSYRVMNERENRIMKPLGRVQGKLQPVSFEQAYQALAERISTLNPGAGDVLVLTDTNASNEALFMFRKFAQDGLGAEQVYCPMPDWQQPESDFFINSLITTDKTPNRAGARELGLTGVADTAELATALAANPKVVIVLGNPFENATELRETLSKAQLIVSISTLFNGWAEIADVVLPGQLHSEQNATYTNKQRRVQRTHSAVQAPRQTRPEWQIFADLLRVLDKDSGLDSADTVLQALGQEVPAFQNISLTGISEAGTLLPGESSDSGRSLVDLRTASA